MGGSLPIGGVAARRRGLHRLALCAAALAACGDGPASPEDPLAGLALRVSPAAGAVPLTIEIRVLADHPAALERLELVAGLLAAFPPR